jgi:prepilin-type N-terminal cleavage/methylation domain-containing protein
MKMLIKKNAEGLTLLELLVVLAVIGIAATFAIPNLSNFTTSRVAEKDLATIRSLIDYAKATSFSKSKTMVLVQTNNSVKIYELRSSDPTKCLGPVDDDKEYSKLKILKSTIAAKHNNNANVTGSYGQSTSRMCFKRDNTSTGGGFEIKYGYDNIYRIEVWPTGFYDITRKIKGTFKEYN